VQVESTSELSKIFQFIS